MLTSYRNRLYANPSDLLASEHRMRRWTTTGKVNSSAQRHTDCRVTHHASDIIAAAMSNDQASVTEPAVVRFQPLPLSHAQLMHLIRTRASALV
jgi:hypothetical protein